MRTKAIAALSFTILAVLAMLTAPLGAQTSNTRRLHELLIEAGVITSGGTSAACLLSGGTACNMTGNIVLEGATADAFETTLAVTDPTADRTFTLPNVTATANAAADISGTTLAANVVTTSVTGVGALGAGSITSGFGAIDTGADNILTTGVLKGGTLQTATSCASAGGTCAVAPAGHVSIATAATTVTVATTAAHTASTILVFENSSLGSTLSVTCNTVTGRTYSVTTVTDATSFVITASAAPAVNPACLSYLILN